MGSLGKAFQQALDDAPERSRRAPRRPPSRARLRAAASANAIAAAGWLGILAFGLGHDLALLKIATGIAGAGTILCAITWLALLGSDHGGLPTALACLAPPIATAYVWSGRAYDRFDLLDHSLLYLAAGFAAFAFGYLVARGVHGATRVVAAVAMVAVVASAAGAGGALSHMVAFGSLTAIGVMTALQLFAAAQRAIP